MEHRSMLFWQCCRELEASYSASSFLPFILSQYGVSQFNSGKRAAKETMKDDMKQRFLQPKKYPKAYP